MARFSRFWTSSSISCPTKYRLYKSLRTRPTSTSGIRLQHLLVHKSPYWRSSNDASWLGMDTSLADDDDDCAWIFHLHEAIIFFKDPRHAKMGLMPYAAGEDIAQPALLAIWSGYT
ncbi:hypothetical protein DPMN_105591 [Dreissena polymorpha]|uniref:Uncharacterized protein n=1 Tax=Dreissena polymorpha TaxID=45954 RepID=A0A9D4K3H6_DREPO|nr:hypothetical protein DPMN_105591 [Dreissena polymorpha]